MHKYTIKFSDIFVFLKKRKFAFFKRKSIHFTFLQTKIKSNKKNKNTVVLIIIGMLRNRLELR